MYLATRAMLRRPGPAGGNITNFIPIDVKVQGVETARRPAARLPGIEFHDQACSIETAVDHILALCRSRR